MPDLAAEVRAAFPANQPAGKDRGRAGMLSTLSAPGHFKLYKLEHLPADDGRMAVFNVVLGSLTFIDFCLLRQKVHGKGLLQKCIPPVLLVA